MTETTDSTTTVKQLRDLVEAFVDERDWHQFHAPKNLSMSLAVEAAELMEHFQWMTGDASRALVDDEPKKAEIADELADVLCYALAIANELAIDVSSAMHGKMAKNREKYPAEDYQGRYE